MKTYNKILKECENTSDLKKLEIVNKAFIDIPYISDNIFYKQKDYWATPKEFFKYGKGDCEDFAISKYFLLIDSGINPDNLYLAYCRVKNESHIVLVAYNIEGSETPLILDNVLNSRIWNTNERTDITPIFAFNHGNYKIINLNWELGNDILGNKWSKWINLLAKVKRGE